MQSQIPHLLPLSIGSVKVGRVGTNKRALQPPLLWSLLISLSSQPSHSRHRTSTDETSAHFSSDYILIAPVRVLTVGMENTHRSCA